MPCNDQSSAEPNSDAKSIEAETGFFTTRAFDPINTVNHEKGLARRPYQLIKEIVRYLH